ncbi:ChbG/HpnK family deacetylase [Stappia stellulata]|uniref:ChbG/HpnK family deacetylase n=1 Tax=Stappia stellulata TaxID=71235 RepID=UPI000414CFDB|nr:ChbG/HpnK family deacetylase [Stappia stellulata]
MKRILMTSADYGLAFGIDRTLRDLIVEGRLSAVGCLVASDLWTREYLPLRDAVDAARHRTLVGLTLALTRPHAPVSVRGRTRFGDAFPSPRWWRWRDPLRLLPAEDLAEEVDAQLICFEEYYQRPPDFLHVADDLLALPRVARTVIKTVALRKHAPALVSPAWPGEGARARRVARGFARQAARARLRVMQRGPAFPPLATLEAQETHLRNGFNGLDDRTMVFCHLGEADDRLRRLEPRADLSVREVQTGFFKSPVFPLLLVEKDIFLY